MDEGNVNIVFRLVDMSDDRLKLDLTLVQEIECTHFDLF